MTEIFNRASEKSNRLYLRKEQTLAEKIVWKHLRNRQFEGIKFRRQYSVFQFIIDFYAPEINLAIEIDGSVHEEHEQKERDILRQKLIEELQITFLRITNDDLFGNPNQTFEKILAKIHQIKTSTSP